MTNKNSKEEQIGGFREETQNVREDEWAHHENPEGSNFAAMMVRQMIKEVTAKAEGSSSINHCR